MSRQNLRDNPLFAVLFNPVKDPKKSWNVDIANIMTIFLNDCIQKPEDVNFVTAALLLQATSSIYGKKVESLYSLCMKLVQVVGNIKNKPKSNEGTKDKDLQQPRVNDEFALVNDLKRCKNLDMVEERVSNVHNKNAVKYLPAIPPDLIHLEDSEKGDINLIDSRGEVLGNKKDFFLNICRMHTSGYLLLPTVNVSCVPNDTDDFSPSVEIELPVNEANENDDDNGGSLNGGDMYDSPPHSPVPDNNPVLDDIPIPNVNPESPLPLLDTFDDILPEQSRRRSMRQVEKAKEKEISLDQQKVWQTSTTEEDNTSKKKIQKKNTRKLPKKLKHKPASDTNNEEDELNPTSQFCSKTFFSMDPKLPKNGVQKNVVEAFEELFIENVQKQTQDLKSFFKAVDLNDEDQNENNHDSDDDRCVSPLNDVLPNDDDIPIEQAGSLHDIDFADTSSNSNLDDLPLSKNYEELVRKHIADYMKDVEQYSQTTDITESVRKWEDGIRPILSEQNTHEPFDMYVYGKRILDAFSNNNRKQAICFQDFCKNKETWQVHRYFLAALQLANNYNVKLTLTKEEDQTTTIYLTLLSRKQHHEEIAEFGHSSGSHDP